MVPQPAQLQEQSTLGRGGAQRFAEWEPARNGPLELAKRDHHAGRARRELKTLPRASPRVPLAARDRDAQLAARERRGELVVAGQLLRDEREHVGSEVAQLELARVHDHAMLRRGARPGARASRALALDPRDSPVQLLELRLHARLARVHGLRERADLEQEAQRLAGRLAVRAAAARGPGAGVVVAAALLGGHGARALSARAS